MGILSSIINLFKPTREVVDSINMPKVKKLELQARLAELEHDVKTKVLEIEGKRLELQAKMYQTDSKSDLLFVRIWRPVTSMFLVATVLIAAFTHITLPEEVYYLCSVFLGGYALGRSGEKIAQVLKK